MSLQLKLILVLTVQAPLGPTAQPPPQPVDRTQQFQSLTHYQVMNKKRNSQ